MSANLHRIAAFFETLLKFLQRAARLIRDRFFRWLLITISMLFAVVFLFLPLINVFVQAFSKGIAGYFSALTTSETAHAIQLTLTVAAITVPLNVVFGVAAAWAVAKFDFPGKTILLTLIDLPFSISPVVSGLMLILLFGAHGLLGPWLEDPYLSLPKLINGTWTWARIWELGHPIPIIFAIPGIVLATIFVTFPFVARELIPLMEAQGAEQEQAALTLGASGWQTFWHVTLPSIKWGLLYGVILCNARAMGEFGAVYVVSGRISGLTETVPLHVEKLYNEFDPAAPFAVASLLALLALVTLGIKTFLEWRGEAEEKSAQRK